MNIDINNLLKEKKELISVALIGGSVLLAVVMLWKVTRFFELSARAQNVVETAMLNNVQTADAEQYLSHDREIASTLSEGNLFYTPPSPQNPVNEVRAIFGDSALINDNENWYKVGDMIEDEARIVAIEPMQVVIEWNGRTYNFSPIDASTPEPQQTGRGSTARAGTQPLQRAEYLIEASQNIGATATTAGGGARIDNVASGRASRFGFQQGDIVVSINGLRVSSGDSLTEVMNSISTGSAVEAQIIRNGVQMTVGRDAVSVGGRGGMMGGTGGRGGRGGRG